MNTLDHDPIVAHCFSGPLVASERFDPPPNVFTTTLCGDLVSEREKIPDMRYIIYPEQLQLAVGDMEERMSKLNLKSDNFKSITGNTAIDFLKFIHDIYVHLDGLAKIFKEHGVSVVKWCQKLHRTIVLMLKKFEEKMVKELRKMSSIRLKLDKNSALSHLKLYQMLPQWMCEMHKETQKYKNHCLWLSKSEYTKSISM